MLEGPAHSCLLRRFLGAQPVGLLQCSFGSQKIAQILEDLGVREVRLRLPGPQPVHS